MTGVEHRRDGADQFRLITSKVLMVSIRQVLTPERLHGRVGATAEFMTWGIMPTGSLRLDDTVRTAA